MTKRMIVISSMRHAMISAVGDILSLALYIIGVGNFINTPSFMLVLCIIGVASVNTVAVTLKDFYCAKATENTKVFEDDEAEKSFTPLKRNYISAVMSKSSAEKTVLPICFILLVVLLSFVNVKNTVYAVITFTCMFTYVINFFFTVTSSNQIINKIEVLVSGKEAK